MAKERFDRNDSEGNGDHTEPPDDLSTDGSQPQQAAGEGPNDPQSSSTVIADGYNDWGELEISDDLTIDGPGSDPVNNSAGGWIELNSVTQTVTRASTSSGTNDDYKYVNVRRFLMIGVGVIIILGIIGLIVFGLPGGGAIPRASSDSGAGGVSAPEATTEPTRKSPPPLLTIDVWEHASVGCIDDLAAEMPVVCISNDGDVLLEWGDLNLPPGAEWCRPADLRLPDGSQPDRSQIMPGDTFDYTLTITNQGPNTSADYPDVAGLFKDTAEGESGPSVVGLSLDEASEDDLDMYLVNAPGGDNALNMDVVALMFLMREVPPYCEPVSVPPPAVTEEPTQEPQDSSQPVSTEEPTEEPGSDELPPPVCGDLICDPRSENTDLCPNDCQCVDDGVCAPGEGDSCQDCGASAGTCGSTCVDSSQCASGLACAGGVCWDAPTCGSDPGGNSGGGSGGDSGGGSCGYGQCGCQPEYKKDYDPDSGCTTIYDSCGNSVVTCN